MRRGFNWFANLRRAILSVHQRLRVRGWIALGLVIALAAALPAALSSRFVARRRALLALHRARSHLAAQEMEPARSELRAALRLDPADVEARQQLAMADLALGDWEFAFLQFEALTELQPENPDGWIGLANVMVKSGLLSTPEAALDRAIAASPGRADARSMRGEIRFRLGRYHGAVLDAQAAVSAAPKDAVSWVLLVRSAARSMGTEAGIEAAWRGIAAVGREPALLEPLAFLLAERGRADEGARMLEEISGGAPAALLTLARVELRAGRRDAARKQLDAYLSSFPIDDDALALRAAMDAAAGRVNGAIADLDEAVKARPPSRALHDFQGRLVGARNDPSALHALLDELVSRDLGPAPISPQRLRAEASAGRDKLAALTREHWPGRLARLRQELELQLRRQNWTEAETIVETARRSCPETSFAPFLAGILELARGNPAAGEKRLAEALWAAPRSRVVVTAMAKAWSAQEGAGFAAQRLMQLADRDPALGFARGIAARAAMDARDPAQAEAALTRDLRDAPGSALPYLQLAEHFSSLDRASDALHTLQQAGERFPEDVEVQSRLAEISADQGRPHDAIPLYEALLSRRPDRDVVAYRLAALLASQGDGPRLRELLQLLRGDRPSDPLLLDALGWAQFRDGDQTRARALLEAAVKGAPEEPAPHFHLAAIYSREKMLDRARSELSAALEPGRPFPERLEALRLLRDSSPDLSLQKR